MSRSTRYAVLVLFASFLSGAISLRGDEHDGFDKERFEASIKIAESRRQDLKVQVEALDEYWEAMNKAVAAQRGSIRNRQLTDAVVDLRRARMDATDKLAEADRKLEDLRSMRQDRTNLCKGSFVTRSGVRAGWKAVFALHETCVATVEEPVGFRQIGSQDRIGQSWLESGASSKAAKPSSEDCPDDVATAIELFGWASRNNLIPRPGTSSAKLVTDFLIQSDGALVAEIDAAIAELTQAEARIVAIRQTTWAGIELPATPKP